MCTKSFAGKVRQVVTVDVAEPAGLAEAVTVAAASVGRSGTAIGA